MYRCAIMHEQCMIPHIMAHIMLRDTTLRMIPHIMAHIMLRDTTLRSVG